MLRRTVGLPLLAVLGFGAFLALDSSPAPASGRAVSDEAAAAVRGGVCQWLAYSTCPGNVFLGCPSGTNVVAGTAIFGQGVGNINCGSSCGSFFNQIIPCGS